MSKEKIISIVALIAVLGGVAVLGFWGYNKTDKEVATTVQNVATVNGVGITQTTYDSQLASVIATLKTQGIDTENADNLNKIKTQTLNDVINNELVVQGVAKAGIKIADADVEAQYQRLVTEAGGADKLKEQLTIANLTEAQFRENISKQLAIQAYLLQNIDVSTATATDAEAKTFYDTNVKGQTGAPAYKDIVEQIKQQIVANKQQLLINTFLVTLREKSTIETSL